jgi:hypothetical protein
MRRTHPHKCRANKKQNKENIRHYSPSACLSVRLCAACRQPACLLASLRMPFCMSACHAAYLPACMHAFLHILLPVNQRAANLKACLPACTHAFLHVSLPAGLLSANLSACLPACMHVFLHISLARQSACCQPASLPASQHGMPFCIHHCQSTHACRQPASLSVGLHACLFAYFPVSQSACSKPASLPASMHAFLHISLPVNPCLPPACEPACHPAL